MKKIILSIIGIFALTGGYVALHKVENQVQPTPARIAIYKRRLFSGK